ncbi:MAG: hypothetical protein AAFY71_20290 [Bacteroidota bacterium]
MRKFFSRLVQLLNDPESNRERKIFVLALAIFLSVILWGLVTLNQNYELELDYVVAMDHVPEQFYLTQQVTNRIRVTASGPGVDLIVESIRAKRDTLFLPFKEGLQFNDKISISAYQKEIKENFKVNTMEITRMEPDDLEFVFEKKQTRRVPLKMITEIPLPLGYQLERKPIVQPESVDIYGAAEQINDIKSWNTREIVIPKIYGSQTLSVPVDTQKGLKISPSEVGVKVFPKPFTETTLSMRLVVNEVPNGMDVRLSDEVLNVTCLLPLDEYEEIRAVYKNKTIELDFNELDPNFPYIIPEVNFPEPILPLSRDPFIVSYVIIIK